MQQFWLSVTRMAQKVPAVIMIMTIPLLLMLFFFTLLSRCCCFANSMYIAGGTIITVTGTNFVASPHLQCRFDTREVSASYASTSQVVCVSPPHVAGNVAVEVSNNALDYTTNNVQFSYQENIELTQLAPSAGPYHGSTVVTVFGSAFVSGAYCKFGTFVGLSSSIVSSSEIKCESPAQPVGFYDVEVTNNAQDFTSLHMLFEYYGMTEQ